MAGREDGDLAAGELGIDERSEFVSFIVRVWKPIQGKHHRCRGWVEEVESGEKTSFLGLDELQGILAKRLAD